MSIEPRHTLLVRRLGDESTCYEVYPRLDRKCQQAVGKPLYASENAMASKLRRSRRHRRMFKKVVQLHPPDPRCAGTHPFPSRGRSEAHAATNKEQHVCARRRVGEPAVSSKPRRTISPARPRRAKTRPFPCSPARPRRYLTLPPCACQDRRLTQWTCPIPWASHTEGGRCTWVPWTRMFKKAIQRGRSERKAEAYPCGTLRL